MKAVTTIVLLIALGAVVLAKPTRVDDKATHLRTPTSGSVWLGLRSKSGLIFQAS